MIKKILLIAISISICFCVLSCSDEDTVTVYTSVDRNYSETIFQEFQEKTGIRVLAVYDTEASKTTGLVNRLIAEKENPIADVFWNGEFSQTLILKDKDVLDPYLSESANDIPTTYKDQDHYWVAFGGRARCFLVNTELLSESEYPSSIEDLISDKYESSKIGIAYPMFGTTATQSGALFSLYGDEKAKAYYQEIKDSGVRVVDGNGAVRDLVANGSLIFGLTDTDDAIAAIKNGKHVKIVFPDQGKDDIGTLIIPNTAALIKGSRQPSNAKIFLDYIYSLETEKRLIEIGWTQVATRDVDIEMIYFDINAIKTMSLSLEEIYKCVEKAKQILKDVFIR